MNSTVQAPDPHRTLHVARTSSAQHSDYLRARCRHSHEVSFLQDASWARVKPEWGAELLGWFDGEEQLGAALVLYRRLPGARRVFAYVPEGPVLDWAALDLGAWIDPLLDHLREAGAFAVRMGPPLAFRRWYTDTLKSAVGPGRQIGHVVPDQVEPLGTSVAEQLREAGWQRRDDNAQPRYVFEVPLAERSLEDVWAGLNQEWRRNIKRATRYGVTAEVGTADYLPAFHELLRTTERRDGFSLGRSLEYFERQFAVLNEEEPERMRLYIARHDGEVLAAHTMITMGRRAWYQTGASASHRREVRPSHALQWRMLRDALAGGAAVYDMRGVPATLDPENRSFGLTRWKLGTGGEVAETLGEWETPLEGTVNRTLHRTMRAYLARR